MWLIVFARACAPWSVLSSIKLQHSPIWQTANLLSINVCVTKNPKSKQIGKSKNIKPRKFKRGTKDEVIEFGSNTIIFNLCTDESIS